MNKSICALALIMLLGKLCLAQKLEPPKLDPTPPTESQQKVIAEGIALHDRGDYDGAISLYQQVLRENPASVTALYEMSFSFFAKKDCQKSIEFSFKAAQYKSHLLGAIYGQIGNCQDDLGRPKEAIETFKAGLKLAPRTALLHYNLGLTYARLQQFEDARAALKKSASLNPDHASSHNLLSVVFDREQYKTPALLAACRFLILEPNSRRSSGAVELIGQIMQAGVSRKSETEISVLMGSPGKKDEGDFAALELTLGLLRAGNYIEKNKAKTPQQLLVGNFESLFAILSEQAGKSKQTQFAWQYYAPYFVELKKQGHTEAFVYYIHQKGDMAGTTEWLADHQDKVNSFLNWSRAYKWPAD